MTAQDALAPTVTMGSHYEAATASGTVRLIILSIDPARLAAAMSEWFTKRGKGNGQAVVVEIREESKAR